jgi:hypothetical protein
MEDLRRFYKLKKEILRHKNGRFSTKKKLFLSTVFVTILLCTIPVCMPIISGSTLQTILDNTNDNYKSNTKIDNNHKYSFDDIDKIIDLIKANGFKEQSNYLDSITIKYLEYIKEHKEDIQSVPSLNDFLLELINIIATIVANLIGVEVPDVDLENEPFCEHDWFKYYWVRYDYIRKQIETTPDCENYEEFWNVTSNWVNSEWIFSLIGVLIEFGVVFGVADIITAGTRPSLGLAGWALILVGSALWIRVAMTIQITRNMFDSLITKQVDIIIKIVDEEGNPINITDENNLPYAINNDLTNTMLYRNCRNDEERNEIINTWTYQIRWLFDINYPNGDEDDPIHWIEFPKPDSESNYDGWYSMSSRKPNPSFEVTQFPPPPGEWTITIPSITIDGEEYFEKTINTGLILPQTFYFNDNVVLIEDDSRDPWVEIIYPQNTIEFSIPLNPPLIFSAHDNEIEPDQTLYVEVWTNATDPTGEKWIELLELYNLEDNYHDGEIITVPTNHTVNIDGVDQSIFNEFDKDYYWKVFVKDNDQPLRHTINETYVFRTEI